MVRNTTFAFTPATGWLDSRTTQHMRLLPGQYHLYVPNQRNPTITLTPAGTFDYDPTLTGISGAGTNTLTAW